MLDRSLIPYRLTAFSLATRRTALTNDKLLGKTAEKKRGALPRSTTAPPRPHARDCPSREEQLRWPFVGKFSKFGR